MALLLHIEIVRIIRASGPSRSPSPALLTPPIRISQPIS